MSPTDELTGPSRPEPALEAAATENPLLRLVVRWRWWIFLTLAIMQIAAFNGRWRIGRDGSLYRAVAHNLATGHGYTFRGQREKHVYPGLPRLLAAVEETVGPEDPLRPVASLTIIALMGALTLVVVYHLVQMYYPLWIAVCVTTGVGVNRLFIEQSHDLMTDVPFMLGACLTLLGIGKLWRETLPSRRLLAGLFIVAGAVLTVSMRPTFWALALPCAAVSIAGMIHSHRRLWYAAGAAAILALVLAWWAIDPRTTGFDPLSGRYETMALSRLRDLGSTRWAEKLDQTCEKHFPIGVLGIQLGLHLGTLFTAIIAVWSIRMIRHAPIWGLFVITTIAMTLVLGSKPRYYLMILPLALVAWALAVHWLSLRARRWRHGPLLVMLIGLGLATAPNVVRSADFIMEQHGIARNLSRKSFLEVYRGGKMLPVYQMSQMIQTRVPPGHKVLGPEPRITTFLSGRPVYHPSEIFGHAKPPLWLGPLRRLGPTYFASGKAFADDKLLGQLIWRKVIEIDLADALHRHGMYVAPIRLPEDMPPRMKRRIERPTTTTATSRPPPRRRRRPAVSTMPTTLSVTSTQPATLPAARPPRRPPARARPSTRP